MNVEAILILILIGALFYGIYWFCGKLTSGVPLQIIGIVLAVVFIIVALNNLGLYHVSLHG